MKTGYVVIQKSKITGHITAVEKVYISIDDVLKAVSSFNKTVGTDYLWDFIKVEIV